MKLFDIFMSRKRHFLNQEHIVISAIHGQFSQVQINPDSTLRENDKKASGLLWYTLHILVFNIFTLREKLNSKL